ncbi:MAG: UbiA family prenyltransferase [Phycisphaerae bacterium]|nr:UbiA family prenyltransferase [Phycisphaerae bacterium]
MEGVLARVSPLLRLTRLTTAFAAVSNVWFVILWTRASHRELDFAPSLFRDKPLWQLLLGGAVFAVGLFAFATALNDTVDLRRDRMLNPDRPLPAGRLSVDTAVMLVAVTMIASVLGATMLGLSAVLMCLLTIAGVLFHTMAARYFPSVGLVTLGLVYGSHMMTPNAYLVFVWPVLFVMAHALLLGAVTHRLARKRPRLTPRRLALASIGWAFWSAVLLYVGWLRAETLWPAWVRPEAAVAPALLAAGFLVYAWNKARVNTNPNRAAEKIRRDGAFWVTLYGIAWTAGQGYSREAWILAALTAGGWLGMTLLRETYGLIESPVGWRR